MKRIFLMTALMLVAVGAAQAQTDKQAKRQAKIEARAKEKAQREAERDARDAMIASEEMQAFLAAKKAIIAQNFVIEGSQIQMRNGYNAFVNANTNFISVQGDQATIQVASMRGGGLNGFGGITVNGTISNIQYNVSKNGNVDYSFSVQGPQISATVDISMSHGSSTVYAAIQPNFNSNRMTMIGTLMPYSQSRIIRGASLL